MIDLLLHFLKKLWIEPFFFCVEVFESLDDFRFRGLFDLDVMGFNFEEEIDDERVDDEVDFDNDGNEDDAFDDVEANGIFFVEVPIFISDLPNNDDIEQFMRLSLFRELALSI